MNWIPSSSRIFKRGQLSGASYFQPSGDAVVLNSDDLFKIHLNTILETQTWNKIVLCKTQLQEQESLTQTTEEKLSLDTGQHNTKCCPESNLTF